MTENTSFELRNRAIDRADGEIVDELRARAGISVSSISDLVNTQTSYSRAYPVLVDFLGRSFPIQIREMIVRALTVKDARDIAFPTLVRIYRELPNESETNDIGFKPFRFALANAIAVLAPRNERGILKEFARNTKFGSSRSVFIRAMRAWNDPEVDNLILEALSDESLQYQAIVAAGKRRLKGALAVLEELAADGEADIRRAALRAIGEIRGDARR